MLIPKSTSVGMLTSSSINNEILKPTASVKKNKKTLDNVKDKF